MKAMPVTGTAFAFCSLSIIGIPPFGGFFSKIMVISAVAQKDKIWIAALAVLAAILTLLYLFRLFSAVFLGKLKYTEVEENSKVMVTCAFFLSITTLVIGIFINQILGLIDMAVINVFY